MDRPFVAFKHPGLSRKGRGEGITEYTDTQYISVENPGPASPPPAPAPRPRTHGSRKAWHANSYGSSLLQE